MSGSAIPASQIVSVVPSVLNAGGVGLDLNGLLITMDTHIPLGEVYSFPDLTAVQSFFGPTSYISMLAGTYFLADINATKRPGALLISCYANNQWVPAWLLSAQKPTLTLEHVAGDHAEQHVHADRQRQHRARPGRSTWLPRPRSLRRRI